MDAGQDVFTHDALVEHDGVLVVVTLPGHVGHQQVATQGDLTVLGGVAFREDVAGLHALSLLADGAQVDGHILVGAAELGNAVFLECRLEADELLFFRAVVENANGRGVHVFHHAVTFCGDHRAGVFAELLLDAGADDGRLAAHQRNGLAHHVRSHQCTVGIIVLQEGNHAGSDRSDLLGSNVHEVDLRRGHHGIVVVLTALHDLTDERAVVSQGRVALTDHQTLFLFGRHIAHALVGEVYHGVLHLAVGGLNEAEVVDLGKHAERADQTDVGTFGRLDGTEAAVVCIVHVAHLKAGTLTRQTAGTQGGETALVRHLGQGVGLVHKLREGVGAEERVDHRSDGLGVDQVAGREYLIIAYVHALAYRAGHAVEADGELVGQLLAHGAHTAVGEMVDIVHVGLRVNQLDEVLDDGDDILLGQHADVVIDAEVQLVVDAVAAHIAEVVTLVREEQVEDHLTGAGIIGRLCITQLTVDIVDGLVLRVGGVLLQGVEDDVEVGALSVLLVHQDAGHAALKNLIDVLFGQFALTGQEHLVTLDAHHFARILVDEVLVPGVEHVGGELLSGEFLEVLAVHLHLLGQIKDLENLAVAFVADGTQQGGHGQLLLTVDVGIHHVVDVRGKLDPTALERDDAGRVELGTVGVQGAGEEHTGRAVQLAHDDTLGAVDDKRAVVGHVGDVAQEDLLNLGVKVHMLVVGAVELQLGLEGHTVGQAALQTLLDGVAGRVDIIVQELQNEIVASVRDGEVLAEDFVESVVLAEFRWSIQLEEVLERLQLHLQEIGIRHRILDRCKIDTVVDNFSHELSAFRFACVYTCIFLDAKR